MRRASSVVLVSAARFASDVHTYTRRRWVSGTDASCYVRLAYIDEQGRGAFERLCIAAGDTA